MAKGPVETFRTPNQQPVKFGNEIAVKSGVGVGVGYVNHGGVVKQHGKSEREYSPPKGEIFPGFPGKR